MTTGEPVLVSEQKPKDNADADFAERYVEHILERLFQTRNWAVADVLLRECPKEHLSNVAFMFLHHFVAHNYARREDMH